VKEGRTEGRSTYGNEGTRGKLALWKLKWKVLLQAQANPPKLAPEAELPSSSLLRCFFASLLLHTTNPHNTQQTHMDQIQQQTKTTDQIFGFSLLHSNLINLTVNRYIIYHTYID